MIFFILCSFSRTPTYARLSVILQLAECSRAKLQEFTNQIIWLVYRNDVWAYNITNTGIGYLKYAVQCGEGESELARIEFVAKLRVQFSFFFQPSTIQLDAISSTDIADFATSSVLRIRSQRRCDENCPTLQFVAGSRNLSFMWVRLEIFQLATFLKSISKRQQNCCNQSSDQQPLLQHTPKIYIIYTVETVSIKNKQSKTTYSLGQLTTHNAVVN